VVTALDLETCARIIGGATDDLWRFALPETFTASG
jgi:hypothetical protein